jgi:glycosyltransferase involved in cell wall biosynthesis
MKVVLVHDTLTERSGAERVLLHLAAAFDKPTIITSVYAPDRTFPEFLDLEVHALHQVPQGLTDRIGAKAFSSPGTFRSLDLHQADLVIVSSTAFAHHVRHPRAAVYWHNPPQVATAPTGGACTPQDSAAPRHHDLEAARAHQLHVANSYRTAVDLRSSFGVDAGVLHPPIDTTWLDPRLDGPAWPPRALVVGRLLPEKRIDVAIAACREVGIPLTVIGEGPDESRLRGMADASVTFVASTSNSALASAYAAHTVVLCPGQDHFGLVALEAGYMGRPVVASSAGGGMETVLHRETGWLVGGWDPVDWANALGSVLQRRWDPQLLRSAANRFDAASFDEGLAQWLRPLLDRDTELSHTPARGVAPSHRSLLAS